MGNVVSSINQKEIKLTSTEFQEDLRVREKQ